MSKYTFNGRLIKPYQVSGTKWMIERDESRDMKGGILADDMGLGKTAQTLYMIVHGCLKHLEAGLEGAAPPTLVVCPLSVVGQWVAETSRFTSLVPMVYARRTDKAFRAQLAMQRPDIVICTYGVFQQKTSCVLDRMEWGRIVLDEGHVIRNPKSLAFKNLMGLHCQGPRWVLTGTPIYNSKKDFSTLMSFVAGTLQPFHVDDTTKSLYVLRRTKNELANTVERLRLPPCHVENRVIDPYPHERLAYKQTFQMCKERLQAYDEDETTKGGGMRNMILLESILRVRQTSIHPGLFLPQYANTASCKMDTLKTCICNQPKGEKTLVFCQFLEEMNCVEKVLQDRTLFRIDGSLSTIERAMVLELFAQAPEDAILIMQIKTGGVGLNIQTATRVYFLSPYWNPATELQAIGRAHRTGQTKEVYVTRLFYSQEEESCPSIDLCLMYLQKNKAVETSTLLQEKLDEHRYKMDVQVPQLSLAEISQYFFS